ncbi:MAG: universal stress protein [Promethearchaeota archaeon]|nr:MAG: universal stress protein [Candidatus Lokiarchaeota archaeon]
MYHRILVGIDESEDSLRAAKRIKEIGKPNSKVVLFHAMENHSKEKTKELLSKTEEIFRGTLFLVETRIVEDESPEDYIIRVSEEQNFDLVALGCKGEHSKVRRVLMGTVATKVLNEAPCDVLIAR